MSKTRYTGLDFYISAVFPFVRCYCFYFVSGGLDVPSVGGDISGDLPSGEVKLTGPDVDVKGRDSSLVAGLAAGVTAAVGAGVAGLGLSGKADKPEGEVRACASQLQ